MNFVKIGLLVCSLSRATPRQTEGLVTSHIEFTYLNCLQDIQGHTSSQLLIWVADNGFKGKSAYGAF